MATIKLKSITPGQRFRVKVNGDELTKNVTPEKSLLCPLKKTGGRNATGKMTMRYIGGRHKRQCRIVDFKRNKDHISAIVKSIEYDPNRTAYIALICYADGQKSYILAPKGLKVGDKVISDNGKQFPTSGISPLPEITLSPTFNPLGANMYDF